MFVQVHAASCALTIALDRHTYYLLARPLRRYEGVVSRGGITSMTICTMILCSPGIRSYPLTSLLHLQPAIVSLETTAQACAGGHLKREAFGQLTVLAASPFFL